MKKIICFFLCIALAAVFPVCANAEDISAEAYVLYCPDNGQIISSKNADKRMKPASTTKLMTSLITLEQAAADNKTLTFTRDMAAEGSSMYLEPGDKLTLRDLAVGMMMSSGNDAANAAAVTISGSGQKFSRLMNDRAKRIGMENTHFVTPSGLDDEQHYSTARDLALLMSEALKNEELARLAARKTASVDFAEPKGKHVTYSNHNRLLSMYEYCVGGKTGYTMAAGRCLVSAAEKDGLTLVCVTLNDRNDWNDHIALYEQGFGSLCACGERDSAFCVEVDCVGGMSESVAVMGESDAFFVAKSEDKDKIRRTVLLDSFLYAPVKSGEVVGKIEYTLDGEALYTVDLTAVDTVERKTVNRNIFQIIKDFFNNE